MTPLFVMCVEPAGFSQMHGGVSAPSCCAFIHRVAFEEVSGHRVLLKCGPGNRGLSACWQPTSLPLGVPCADSSCSWSLQTMHPSVYPKPRVLIFLNFKIRRHLRGHLVGLLPGVGILSPPALAPRLSVAGSVQLCRECAAIPDSAFPR